MEDDFDESRKTKPLGWAVIAAMVVMVPFLVVIVNRVDLPKPFLWLCVLAPCSIAVLAGISLLRGSGCQRWALKDDEVIYGSPGEGFGKSFRVPLNEVTDVSRALDSDFATLHTRGDGDLIFHVASIQGLKFLEHLRARLNRAND